MRQDIYGEIFAALKSADSSGLLGGPFMGAPPPRMMADKVLFPPHLVYSANTSTSTGARYYAVPFYIPRAMIFAGVKFYNSGTGDNGDKVKIAFYNESSSGGPGTLAKDFGEVTLTGAAAIRTLASSWSAVKGWYWGIIVSDNAVAFAGMEPVMLRSDVGWLAKPLLTNQIGPFSADILGSAATTVYQGDYVAGTYANFPEATALTLTTSIVNINGTLAFIPAFCLYV